MDRPPRHRVILLSFVLPAILAGCDQSSSRDGPSAPENEVRPSLIAEADREHDFGPVIASPGRKVEHLYRLTNPTHRDVKILNVINRKPCCGTVRAEAAVLRPGDTTDVAVTLLVGDRFGDVAHMVEVVTDAPEQPSRVLRTMARAIPPFRIEEDSAFDRMTLVGTKKPRQAAYRVFAAGTMAEPPNGLDRLVLRSTIRVEWAGSKEPSASDDGLQVESRRFIAWLDPAGPLGERRAEFLLMEGERAHGRHVVTWEIAPRMTASPKVIAIRSNQRDYRIVIRAQDRKPFRVKRIESKETGIRGRVADASAGIAHTVHVEGVQPLKERRGAITVLTDHPIQERVDLPFVIID